MSQVSLINSFNECTCFACCFVSKSLDREGGDAKCPKKVKYSGLNLGVKKRVDFVVEEKEKERGRERRRDEREKITSYLRLIQTVTGVHLHTSCKFVMIYDLPKNILVTMTP